MKRFFKPEEEQRIIESIRQAESHTSGEIRVHLEKNSKGNVLQEAATTFKRLKMDQTQARNGVLLFLAPQRRQFAIIGDQGINAVVPENFWQAERDLLRDHFRQGAFCEGICQVVLQVGEKLKEHFPHQEDDTNELSDEISYS